MSTVFLFMDSRITCSGCANDNVRGNLQIPFTLLVVLVLHVAEAARPKSRFP